MNNFFDTAKKYFVKYKEIIGYLFFGVLTTAVSFASAWAAKLVLEKLGFGTDAVSDISTVFSWICAVTFAYFTNRSLVFGSTASGFSSKLIEALKFYAGRLFTLFVEFLIMRIFFAELSFDYWLVKIFANVIILILNYIISKLIVFSKRK